MSRHHHRDPAHAPDREQGFTLIELLIVIAVLGIVSTIVVLSVRGITDKGSSAACRSDDRTLRTAYEAYSAKGTPAFTGFGSFEDFLVAQGFLAEVSSKYDLASDGTVTATTSGGCAAVTTVASAPAAPAAAASSASAGSPGAWLPSGATPPSNLSALQASQIFPAGGPQSWGDDQWVLLADGTPATWGGAGIGWLMAIATNATPGTPGTWLPAGAVPYPNFQMLTNSGIGLNQPAWPPNAYVLLGDSTAVRWDGQSWVIFT